MKILAILICINFSIIPRFSNSFSFNLTNLMMHQLTMCGPAGICNITRFNFEDLDMQNMPNSHKLCPNCFCDNSCFGRGDCCPDKYFALSGLVCDNVTFVYATQDESRLQRSFFLTIKNCPHGTEQVKAKMCEHEYEDLNKLKYPPVTSNLTNLTYANRFCAQCHDETSYQFWNLDIKCKEFLDINFLSSFKEVIDSGIEKRCVMQFVPHEDKPAFNCFHRHFYHFNSCNKTGFWKTRDDDILNACQSVYVNNDTLFKNSYCRMCNPTFYEGGVITQCNVTGLWNFFDNKIKQACSRFGLNEGTLPFKNIFCRICNAPENMSDSYVDASASVKIELLININHHNVYYTTIEINNFLKDYFDFVINAIPKSEHKMTEKIQTLNMTNLIYKLFSMKKYVGVCKNYSIPEKLSSLFIPCSCHPSCFLFDDCCEDFVLQYPTGCIDSKALAGKNFKWPFDSGPQYLVTNGCFMQFRYPVYLEKLCRQGGNNNILSSHPVLDRNTGISYLNMFCYLCNKPPKRPSFKLGEPWDIQMFCDKFIEHRNFLTVSHLVKTIIGTHCNVTYIPKSRKTAMCSKSEYVRYNGKCNSTGKWLVEDPEIKYACENVSLWQINEFYSQSGLNDKTYCEFERPQKNAFCAICNPEVTQDILPVSSCFFTEGHSMYDELNVIGCGFFPQIEFYSPFKNLFCKLCNTTFPKYECATGDFYIPHTFGSRSLAWYPIYRNLFVYSDHDEVLSENESPKCKSTQAYISKLNQCRNLTCYPGKYLHNGTCRALFTVSKNLGYFSTLDYQGNVSSLLPVYDLLVIISKQIKQTILSELQIGSDSIEYLFVQIDQTCFKKNQTLSSQHFSGSVSVGLFIKRAVQRVNFEMLLIAFTTKMMISRNETLYLQFSFTKRTSNLHFNPYKLYLAEYFSRCTLPEFVKYQVVANRQKYQTVWISKQLTCVQVSLDFDEYHLDKQSGKLTVFGIDKIYDQDLFVTLPDGSARICVEDLDIETNTVALFSNQESEFLLSKLTLILNVISILCLLISFLIYVFKKDLRTVPGKINMLLILSLGLTLTVFQLSKFGTPQKMACVGFGIALHYFWLMSFSSMMVSSFHMYRIFQFSNINTSDGFNNILRVYIAFITISPCVVVVLNIIISWQVSGNGDIGYGNRRCFIDNPYSRLASFIIPIGVICICSLLFFVRTIISIKRVPNIPGNQSVRNEFGIFCRLFTITGIAWALQIIDGFLPFSTFSYISSIINSLQGTAIFIAFFLNKRVMNCKCTTRNDSHNKTQAKTESTEESYTDVTRL